MSGEGLRVLHVLHQFLPDHVGGVELHTRALTRVQAARGHEVSLFFRRSGEGVGLERWEEAGGVQVWAARAGTVTPTGRFLASFRGAPLVDGFERVLDATRPQVVHVQHLMGLPFGLANSLWRRGLPYVVTLHDYWWGCANAQLLTNDREALCEGPQAWINCGRCALARAGQGDAALHLAPALAPLFAYRHQRARAVLARAARLIAPTAFTRAMYGRMGFPVERIEVVAHGIEAPPTVPRAGEHGERLRIAFVGGIAPQKGLHVLLEAVNRLPHEGVSLAIFGNPDAFPDYAAQLRAATRHPLVAWHGPLPNEQVVSTLAAMDVLVVPSLWYETAALVIQEAFAAGVPVVASALGALRERVRDGVDGLLVPPGDADALAATLRRLLDERGLLARLRVAIQPVRTIQQQAAEIEALYRDALAH